MGFLNKKKAYAGGAFALLLADSVKAAQEGGEEKEPLKKTKGKKKNHFQPSGG